MAPIKAQKTAILKEAGLTVALLQALSKQSDYRVDLKTIPPSASGLMYIVAFVVTLFRNDWPLLLSPDKMAEFSSGLETFNGVPREEKMKELTGWWDEIKAKDPQFDRLKWPAFDQAKFADCVGKNTLAAMIIGDPKKQEMMKGKYEYSDEVKKVCNRIRSKD